MRAIVLGGYGTFGAQVSRELAASGVAVTVAGRDQARAQAFARSLEEGHSGIFADARDKASCLRAIAGEGDAAAAVACSCAGPFSTLGPALLEACLEAGCHYADIADDRAYAALCRSHGERFRERGLTAAYGCSSLPSVSGALALAAAEGGQRLATLPCAFAALRLCEPGPAARGAVTAYELLGARALLDRLIARGFALSLGAAGEAW